MAPDFVLASLGGSVFCHVVCVLKAWRGMIPAPMRTRQPQVSAMLQDILMLDMPPPTVPLQARMSDMELLAASLAIPRVPDVCSMSGPHL